MTFNTSESKQADLKQNEFEFRAHIFRSTTFIYAVGPMYLEASTYYSQGIWSASLLSSIGITLTSIFSYVYFRLTKSFDPILIPSLIVKLLLFSFGLYSTGGIFSDQLYYFPLAVLLNGILLGKRGALFTAGYSVVFTCFLGFWGANGLTVRHETHSPLALSEHVIGTLLFTAWLVYAYEKNRLDGSVRLSNTIGSLTRSEKRHALIQKLDLVLIESENELELAKAAIRALCLELGYVYGNYFTLEAESKRLTLKALWTLNGDDTKAFETISREMGFESGRGLPGRVHKSRKSECIADVVQDKNFPRAQAAEASGLHGAVAFPIYIANEVFGIIEVFSREPASVDPRLLLDLESIGLRIGQVIATFHADLAAKRKENFLGDIIDASPSLIFAKNTHGKYVKVNRAFAQFQNRTKAEIIGKTASDFLANEEVEKRSLIEEQVIAEKKTIVFEEQILTSLGMRWHLTTLFPVLDESGNLLGVGGQHVDIHDQKKLERVHSSMINALNASAIVAMTDERGKITFANDKFTEVTGYTREELLGKDHRILNSGHHSPEFFKNLWTTIRSGRTWRGEVKNRRKDGTFYWVHTTISPLQVADADSKFIAIRFDITAEKEVQTKLMHSSQMASLSEMAGGIAHEINNPLAIIMGKATSIRGRIERGKIEPEKLDSDLQKIEITVERIGKIISGLRSFSRNAEADPMERYSLGRIIEDTLELCKERFKHHGIDLSVSCSADVFINCRPAQVAQVLMNLLSNAHDAVQSLSEKWVRLEVSLRDDRVRISVTDSGAGISLDVAEKIMRPFFTTKDVGKGTGLGLSISKGLIEDHHGSLTYDSTSKHTCFVIDLPVATDDAEKNAA